MIYEVFIWTYDDGKPEENFVGTISDKCIDLFTTYLVKTCGFMECTPNCLYLRHLVNHAVDINRIERAADYGLNLDDFEGNCYGGTELVRITEAEDVGSIRAENFGQIMKPLSDRYCNLGKGLWFAVQNYD